MDPFSLAIGAVGLGLQLFGAAESNSANKRQAKAQAKASKAQAQLAAELANKKNEIIAKQNAIINDKIIPLLQQQKGFLQAAADAQIRAENLRETQMNLDALRMKRDIVRNMVAAKAYSLVTASGQGASLKSSSVFGSLSQITSTGERQSRDTNQNVQIGAGIFDANRAYTSASSSANQIGTDINILESQIGTLTNEASALTNTYQAKIGAAGVVKGGGGNNGAFYSAAGQGILGAAPQLTSLGKTAIFGSSDPWYSTSYGQQLNNPSNWTQGPNGTMIGPAFPSV